MNKTHPALVLVFSMLALAGCASAPHYQAPKIAVPSNYKEIGPWKLAKPSDDLLRGDWWQLFSDKTLSGLEARIDSNNPNIKVYLERFNQAKAYTEIAQSSNYPTISAFGQTSNNRQSNDRPLRGSNQPDVYGTNTFGLSVNYEVDFWGRIHNLVESGKALTQASAADLESARLSLQAELASNYFVLRGLDAQEVLYTETVSNYQKQLALTTNLHDQGAVSGIDVSRSKSQLEEAKTQLASISEQRARYEHAIAALIGEPASTFSLTPLDIGNIQQPEIPVSVPSTLLQRRPDIAAAERRVAALNADIGVARAAFFPSIALGLAAGFQNTGGLGLLSAPNIFWALGPSALMTIFDGGARKAEVKRVMAKTDEAAAAYRVTVLQAFKEVEDNLSSLRWLNDQRNSAYAANTAAKHTLELAMNQYKEGIASYLDVVDAGTVALRTEEVALNINTQVLKTNIALIRALGGGWSENKQLSSNVE
jgi:NodT family efflux transporter outer membrane factor (OMF) lipoprotein